MTPLFWVGGCATRTDQKDRYADERKIKNGKKKTKKRQERKAWPLGWFNSFFELPFRFMAHAGAISVSRITPFTCRCAVAKIPLAPHQKCHRAHTLCAAHPFFTHSISLFLLCVIIHWPNISAYQPTNLCTLHDCFFQKFHLRHRNSPRKLPTSAFDAATFYPRLQT